MKRCGIVLACLQLVVGFQLLPCTAASVLRSSAHAGLTAPSLAMNKAPNFEDDSFKPDSGISPMETEAPVTSLYNVPNALTLLRVLSIPVFGGVFFAENPVRNVVCAAIFALAAVTDWLDGWWARKYNIVSPFGAFLDPVADKLIVAVALILLSERLGPWMSVCASIILCREIGVSALREWMAQIGERDSVKVGMAGKCKTAMQMVSLTVLLWTMPGGTTHTNFAAELFRIGGWVVRSTGLTVYSGSLYLQAAWPALIGKKRS
ncbi:unnamed protein product [Chrysoparadoxa australica]